jgi:hypothetical protein
MADALVALIILTLTFTAAIRPVAAAAARIQTIASGMTEALGARQLALDFVDSP